MCVRLTEASIRVSLKFAAILRTTIRIKHVKRHQDQERPKHSSKGRGR